jgi:hypothetical protein
VKKANSVIPSPPLSAPVPGRGVLALKQSGVHAPQSFRRARNPSLRESSQRRRSDGYIGAGCNHPSGGPHDHEVNAPGPALRRSVVAQGAATCFRCEAVGLFGLLLRFFGCPILRALAPVKTRALKRRREGWVSFRSVWVMPRAWPWKRAKDETLSFRGVRLGRMTRNLVLVLVAPPRFANPSTSRQTG